jgi:hypothetical protein
MGCYQDVESTLNRCLPGGIQSGAGSAAQSAVNAVAASNSVSIVSVFPIGAVLAPWILAAQVAASADDYSDLIDLKEKNVYRCKCGKCSEDLEYFIDKKSKNMGHKVVAGFTGGAWGLLHSAWSFAKSFDSDSGKNKHSKSLHKNAQDGCIKAMASIFFLVSDNSWFRGGEEGTMKRAVAIIASHDGWEELKKNT